MIGDFSMSNVTAMSNVTEGDIFSMAIETAKKIYSERFKTFDKALKEGKLHRSSFFSRLAVISVPIPKTFYLNTDATKQKLKSWVNVKTKLLPSITSASLFSTVIFYYCNHSPLFLLPSSSPNTIAAA